MPCMQLHYCVNETPPCTVWLETPGLHKLPTSPDSHAALPAASLQLHGPCPHQIDTYALQFLLSENPRLCGWPPRPTEPHRKTAAVERALTPARLAAWRQILALRGGSETRAELLKQFVWGLHIVEVCLGLAMLAWGLAAR